MPRPIEHATRAVARGLAVGFLSFLALPGCSSEEASPSSAENPASCHAELAEGAACVSSCQLLDTCRCTTGYFFVCCVRGRVARGTLGCVDTSAAAAGCGCTLEQPDTGLSDVHGD